MARSFLCIKCSLEFPTDAIYQAHKLSGHKVNKDLAKPLDTPPVPTPPPGVPQEALPTPEFIEQVKRIEGEKNPEEQASIASQHPSELPKAIPLQLTYKYIGECPEHRVPIDTLELDVLKTHFCIAFCAAGKHQVEEKQVEKL